jgi:type VI protein secretion system component VasF
MSDTIAAKEREVERNREQLAQTVDALHDKLDVKSQAQARLREAKERATTADGKPKPVVMAGAAAVVFGVAGLIWWRRR